MKILQKLAPVFRGLAAVFAALLALIIAAIPITQIDDVKTAIDGIFGIETRLVQKESSDADVQDYALCTYGDSEGRIVPLFELKPSNPEIKAPEYDTITPAWEKALDSLVIAFGVITGVFGAAWLVTEIVPMFVGKKEEN